jgi:hypothetical protein
LDQVSVAGAAAAGTDGEATGELNIGGRGEGSRFLVVTCIQSIPPFAAGGSKHNILAVPS